LHRADYLFEAWRGTEGEPGGEPTL
jgi:hypothetical protein